MPGRPSQHWYAKDTGKLGDLATAAFEILGRCVQSSTSLTKKTGWKNVGEFQVVFGALSSQWLMNGLQALHRVLGLSSGPPIRRKIGESLHTLRPLQVPMLAQFNHHRNVKCPRTSRLCRSMASKSRPHIGQIEGGRCQSKSLCQDRLKLASAWSCPAANISTTSLAPPLSEVRCRRNPLCVRVSAPHKGS